MPIVEISIVNLLPTKIARPLEQAADHSSSGNPEGISKECGKGGKPASWLSMLSMLCHFHGLLFARQCWMNRYATQRNAPHPPRNAYRERLSLSALAIGRSPTS